MQNTQNPIHNNGHVSSNGQAPASSVPGTPSEPVSASPATGVPASPADGYPAPAPHDWITRLRDKWGNRLGWSSVFSIPTIEDVPLEQTPLAEGLRIIAEKSPVRAATLHHFYDFKLRPALRRFWHVLTEETARVEERNAYAARHNAETDLAQQALEAARDEATSENRQIRDDLEDGPLAVAHEMAAERVSQTGGCYDPTDPSDACVLRHAHRPLEVHAAEMRLPGPHGDRHALLPEWLGWVLTVLVGVLVGLSLGIVTHMLEADTVARHLGLAAGFAVLGFGLATVAKWAVRGAWYRVGQDYYLGCTRSKWGVMLAGAMLRSALVLVVDVVMERQGLLALMQLNADTAALSGHVSGRTLVDEMVSWVVPMVVTFAYLACAGDAGYLAGRREEVKNHLSARQEQEWTDTDAARRAEPVVQDALHALAHVREVLRQRDGMTGRIETLAAPFDAKIAALEGQRLPERVEMDEAGRRRVQDALDNFQGAQYTFDVMWEEALADGEGTGGGWWRRLLRAVGGYRSPRRTRREKTDRREK